ncbi:septal ring factor EnvC (AmiA/AmiB activator) [Methanofollis sp. W23]|uniref:hypothetical protein n=1 Tax=Methanofollis sp. W23 TaxID=2817849 RepID=UPI001AE28C41|nr:hypothetical protein [Methanofollis sp. W23]MBP2145431.1 septal ring factor EnvC (AmiA/AmiB activator) [Methanofollis sp. W23]
MAFLDMLVNRNQTPESEPTEPSEKECYICRRSEEEIQALTATMTGEIDMKIQLLYNKINVRKTEFTQYYQSMVDQLAGNQYLDLKIETIKTDIPNFSKKIPNVNEIIQKSQDDSETVQTVVSRLKVAIDQMAKNPDYDLSKDHPEVKNTYNEIQTLEEEKTLIANYLKLQSKELCTNNSGRDQIRVHLCGICSGLLEEASRGSYTTVEESSEN